MPTFEEIQAEIAAMLDVPDDELTDEQRQAMEEYLDELGQQEADKVDGFAHVMRMQKARMEALKAEAKRLTAKAKTIEGRLGYMQHCYSIIMRKHGLSKVQGNAYTLSLRKSQSIAVMVDPAALDARFQRHKELVEADKTAIKDAIMAGETVRGCALIESYGLQVR